MVNLQPCELWGEGAQRAASITSSIILSGTVVDLNPRTERRDAIAAVTGPIRFPLPAHEMLGPAGTLASAGRDVGTGVLFGVTNGSPYGERRQGHVEMLDPHRG